MRVYLDCCCLNRPFDDQSQDRVRLEAEAVLAILRRIAGGEWEWAGSDVLLHETMKMPNLTRRERVLTICRHIGSHVSVGQVDSGRAEDLRRRGFKAIDALHVVCAEMSSCDALLTTDRQMIAAAQRNESFLRVRVDNPLRWLDEVLRP